MIRITQQDSARDAKTILRDGGLLQRRPGNRRLAGAAKVPSRLGLEGTVDKFSFERLCDNLDPRTGKPLTVRTRTERTVGYDFTFSVPESRCRCYMP